MKNPTPKIVLALALLTGAVTELRAQTYSVNWSKVAGGGGTSTNCNYTVSGTFGQPDAGGPMQGGGYSVEGGFWSLFAMQTYNPSGVAPAITSEPESLDYTNGAADSFGVSVSGTGPLFYQWQENGTNLVDGGSVFGSTTPSLTLSDTTANEAGNYSVIIENAYGSVTSSIATLVTFPPAIATQPQGVIVWNGAPASFRVTASGTPPFNYQWQKNGANLTDGGNISGSATTNLVLSTTATSDTGGYTVTVASAWGSVISSVAKLTLILPAYTTPQGLVYHASSSIFYEGFDYYYDNPYWAFYSSGPDAIQVVNQSGSVNTYSWYAGLKWICDPTTGYIYLGGDGYYPEWSVSKSMTYVLDDYGSFEEIVPSVTWNGNDKWVNDFATGLAYHGNSDSSGNPYWAYYSSVPDAILDFNQLGSVDAPVDWSFNDKWFSDPTTGLAYHGFSDSSGNPYFDVFPNMEYAILNIDSLGTVYSATDWNFNDQWVGVYNPAMPVPFNFPPQFEAMYRSGGNFTFVWNTVNAYPPVGYQVQYSTNLTITNWNNLGGVLSSPGPVTDPTLSATDTNRTDAQRFYRIELVQ